MKKFLLFSFILFTLLRVYAEKDSTAITLTNEAYLAAYQSYMDSIENTLIYDTTTVTIRNGLATIRVPKGFKYLNGEQSQMVLTELWGNPPNEGDDRSLGMLFPTQVGPFTDSSFAINITYYEDGHIDDSDAQSIDYDVLLLDMQKAVAEESISIEAMGYPAHQIVGWASAPSYDERNKKLHWALEVKFDGDEQNTLNYKILILGRKGYLILNVIGDMEVLDDVKEQIDYILQSVEFHTGFKYSDFNPSIDKLAAVGIGGLIAGKAIIKTGILAKLGFFLAKIWKVLIIALIAFSTWIKSFTNKKQKDESIR